ncbi:unnamed protein product [Penicillium salamii]|uniref:Enoyl reductase (ER) domain-containing protein n=1 Tax=Penicillium salamii TaxID=1612424 RepID=A0A9W4JG90_9EURO|nr:unnamed protein product [Penicillium salamii]CAG8363110.1 unnamed protein product [Penicillium salamii]CAG8388756.1 unnamed protein product [Penicillium salamii]CAG8392191.1 unnamed protein product [Penicillium salamii]
MKSTPQTGQRATSPTNTQCRPSASQGIACRTEPNRRYVKHLSLHRQGSRAAVQCFDSNAFGDGAVLGCDFVGQVTELGEGVTRLVPGDIVAGLIWGGEISGLGGYSQYSIADQRISLKVPDNISRAEASSVPLAATTAWLALFSEGCLNIDRFKAGTSVLIWGGSSSVGLYAIQLASIFGLNVITTCSPRNADLVRSYGAQHVFDYNDPDVIANITKAAPDIQHVFDSIGDKTSSGKSSQAFGDRPGNLCTVRPGKANTEYVTANTHVTDVLVWTAFLKDHGYGEFHWPASQKDHELASELFERLPSWLAQGQVKPNKAKIFHGLESVAQGFQEYRDGGVSAYKIVYEI